MNAACNKDRRATTAHKVSHNHVCYQGSHVAPPMYSPRIYNHVYSHRVGVYYEYGTFN